jgi:hypothetical protein
MYKKAQHGRLGAALVFASLLVFTSCEHPGGSAGLPASEFEITGIPQKTARGKDSYKIFVQFSKGTSADAGYVAKGEALIEGKDSVVMELKDPEGKTWSGDGTFNIAIVLSPNTVATWEDIDVYGHMDVAFSSENRSLAWTEGLIYLNNIPFTSRLVKEIFDGGDSGKPGIICVPESGIDYPGKP